MQSELKTGDFAPRGEPSGLSSPSSSPSELSAASPPTSPSSSSSPSEFSSVTPLSPSESAPVGEQAEFDVQTPVVVPRGYKEVRIQVSATQIVVVDNAGQKVADMIPVLANTASKRIL